MCIYILNYNKKKKISLKYFLIMLMDINFYNFNFLFLKMILNNYDKSLTASLCPGKAFKLFIFDCQYLIVPE